MKKMKKFVPTLTVSSVAVGMMPLALTSCAVASSEIDLLNVYRPTFEKCTDSSLNLGEANQKWSEFLEIGMKNNHKDYFAQDYYAATSRSINGIISRNPTGEIAKEEKARELKSAKAPSISLPGNTYTYVSKDIESMTNISLSFDHTAVLTNIAGEKFEFKMPVLSFTWKCTALSDWTDAGKLKIADKVNAINPDKKVVIDGGVETSLVERKDDCVYTNVPFIITYGSSSLTNEDTWFITPIFDLNRYKEDDKGKIIYNKKIIVNDENWTLTTLDFFDWNIDYNETKTITPYDTSVVDGKTIRNISFVTNATKSTQFTDDEWFTLDNVLSAPFSGSYFLSRVSYGG